MLRVGITVIYELTVVKPPMEGKREGGECKESCKYLSSRKQVMNHAGLTLNKEPRCDKDKNWNSVTRRDGLKVCGINYCCDGFRCHRLLVT